MRTPKAHPYDSELAAKVLRSLRAELTPAEEAALAARLDADPAAATQAEALRRSWDALALAPTPAFDAAPALLARLRAERDGRDELSWSAAPFWARATAAAALLLGLVGGYGLIESELPALVEDETVAHLRELVGEDSWDDAELGMAEDWWTAAEVEELLEGEGVVQ
jgi:anti-sigma factor RsiW